MNVDRNTFSKSYVSSGTGVVSLKVIEGLRNGDHSSFDKIFYMYYNKVFNLINSMLKDRDDAEDLVEDVFVTLWDKRENIDPGKNFDRFLYVMSRNAVFNYFRSKKVRNKYLDNISLEEVGCASDEEFIAKETELLVRMTIDTMPKQRRNVFAMSRNEGLTNDQISEKLGISKKAVEKQLRLALNDIRKVLYVAFLFWL